MNKVIGRVKKIFLEILPAFIFFLVMFHMLAVSKAMVLKQYGIIVPSTTIAVVGSLIVAKAVLITDRLPFVNLYPRKPLIYTVLAKMAAFGVITIIFFLLEAFIHLGVRTGNFSGAWARMSADINWQAFWLRQAWIFMLIFFYCAAVELARILGVSRIREIFFGGQNEENGK